MFIGWAISKKVPFQWKSVARDTINGSPIDRQQNADAWTSTFKEVQNALHSNPPLGLLECDIRLPKYKHRHLPRNSHPGAHCRSLWRPLCKGSMHYADPCCVVMVTLTIRTLLGNREHSPHGLLKSHTRTYRYYLDASLSRCYTRWFAYVNGPIIHG